MSKLTNCPNIPYQNPISLIYPQISNYHTYTVHVTHPNTNRVTFTMHDVTENDQIKHELRREWGSFKTFGTNDDHFKHSVKWGPSAINTTKMMTKMYLSLYFIIVEISG